MDCAQGASGTGDTASNTERQPQSRGTQPEQVGHILSQISELVQQQHGQQHNHQLEANRGDAQSNPPSINSVTLTALEAKARACEVPMALLVLDGCLPEISAGNQDLDSLATLPVKNTQLAPPPPGSTSVSPNIEFPGAKLYKPASCVWVNNAFVRRTEASCKTVASCSEARRQAAVATANHVASSCVTFQRHVLGFCKNMAMGKQDPVSFWNVFFPAVAKVEHITMWPCELLDTDRSCKGHASVVHRAIMVSAQTGLSVEEERNVLLKQHMAYQTAPCMVTVLDKEGCIVSQNAESAALLGCRSLEHGPRAAKGEWGPVNILKELCYGQEDLLGDIQRTLERQEPYLDRAEIRSPLLRKWMGVPAGERVWHRIHLMKLTDPFSHQEGYCLWQLDVTDVITAELQVLELQQQYSALLSSILPKQVIDRLLGHKGAIMAGTAYPLMGFSLLDPLLRTQDPLFNNGPHISRLPVTNEVEPQAPGSVSEAVQAHTESGNVTGASDDTQPAQPPLFPARPPTQQQQQQEQMSAAWKSRLTRARLMGQVDPKMPGPWSLLSPQTWQQVPQQHSTPSLSPTTGMKERPKAPGQWLGLTGQDVLELATFHDKVTILFADIKGFTSLVNLLHPSQVMLFLNTLYSTWDSLLESHEVYKVETIGDCYMAAAGLFCYDEVTGSKRLGGHDPLHAHKLLEFAKAMLQSSRSIQTPLGDPVQVRIGIHSGPCSSGVVGQRMPRFCLFGDTVNTAARMESNGVPGCIHASEASVKCLPEEDWRPTGGIIAKGKGLMQTSLLPVIPSSAFAAANGGRQPSGPRPTSHDSSTSLSASQCDADDTRLPSLGSLASDPSLSFPH